MTKHKKQKRFSAADNRDFQITVFQSFLFVIISAIVLTLTKQKFSFINILLSALSFFTIVYIPIVKDERKYNIFIQGIHTSTIYKLLSITGLGSCFYLALPVLVECLLKHGPKILFKPILSDYIVPFLSYVYGIAALGLFLCVSLGTIMHYLLRK